MNTPIELGHALRQLPLEAPPTSAWPALQSHLPKMPIRRFWPLAAAASAALLAVLIQFNGFSGTPVAAPSASHDSPADITQLVTRSAQLENIFYAVQDDDQSSATVIASNIGIEDRLDAIDAELAGQPDPAEVLALWQQRVALLDQGVVLNRTNAAYHAEGNNFDLALASLN